MKQSSRHSKNSHFICQSKSCLANQSVHNFAHLCALTFPFINQPSVSQVLGNTWVFCASFTLSLHTFKAMQNSGTGWVKNPQLPTVVFYLQSYSSSCPKLSDVKQNARGAGVPGRRNTLKFPFPAPLLSLSMNLSHCTVQGNKNCFAEPKSSYLCGSSVIREGREMV